MYISVCIQIIQTILIIIAGVGCRVRDFEFRVSGLGFWFRMGFGSFVERFSGCYILCGVWGWMVSSSLGFGGVGVGVEGSGGSGSA